MSAARSSGAWQAQALEAVRRWSSPQAELEVIKTHRQDHLLAVCTVGGRRRFVKAFEAASEGDMHREIAAYQRLAGAPGVPKLHHADLPGRFMVTDYVSRGRLGAADSLTQRAALHQVPALYASIATGPVGAAPAHPEYTSAWSRLSGSPHIEHLPDPAVVWSLVEAMPARDVHGDFQPNNVLLGADGPVAVDFESYGPDVPALDVARLAYNPALELSPGERDALADDMLDRLAEHDTPRSTRRQLAACCVLWAVACSGYFKQVLQDQRDALDHSPEVVMLSTQPLAFAADLWNQEM